MVAVALLAMPMAAQTPPAVTSPIELPAAAPDPPLPKPAPPLSSAPAVENGGLDHILPAAEPAKRFRLDAVWDNGLRFESEDKQFSIHVGGNAQVDSTWLIGPHSVFALPGGATNGVDNAAATFLRRVRFRFDGEIYGMFDYVVEYDLANANNENDGLEPPSFGNISGSPAPCNIWMQMRDVPFFGNVRVGNQVKPIGMTNNTNQGNLPFVERPDNMDAFYGPFDSGFALGVTSRHVSESESSTFQYGIYRPSINIFGVGINKMEYGARITGLPLYEDEGRELVHIGFGTLDGELAADEIKLRARPELRNGPGYANPVLLNTGTVQAADQYTLAPEFAAVYNSWTLQAEWTGQFVTAAVAPSGAAQGQAFFQGGYVELLYFLTGEYQEYDKREGSFGRVVPRNSFRFAKGDGDCSGWGAWQIGARFSYLDLSDKAIQGGAIYDWTAGLNWFLNANMKWQFNYVLEHRDQPGVLPGWINGLGMRMAFDF